jgi:MFS family permease
MTVTLSQYMEGNFTNGVSLFAWMMTVNAIVVIIFQLPFTRWAEKHSPLRAIVIGNILYAIGDLGFAFSSSWWAFMLSMVVFTWGEVFTFPAGTVLIDRIAPEHLRGTYYGAQQLMFLGHFIGPWFGGFLLQSYSGKVMFITVAVLSLCATYFYRVGESKVRLRPS